MNAVRAVALVLVVASTAAAAPNVGNANQKGSLLVFPDIRIDTEAGGTWNTLVRIENDGTQDVTTLCYWMDGNKNRVNFLMGVTRNQPLWFDARTGAGTRQVNRFPQTRANGIDNPFLPGGDVPYGTGLLACWATDEMVWSQAKWNHLSGTATVYHPTLGAYEYNASAFVVPTGLDLHPIGVAGTLRMNGVEYDACPLYMIGQFSPVGASAAGAPLVARNRLAVAGCILNFNQDWRPVWTMLHFDIWNEDEVKFTGAYECSDSWHETTVSPGTIAVGGHAAGISAFEDGVDGAALNFAFSTLGTYAARFRVQGIQSSQCENAAIKTEAVGMLGVQSTEVDGRVVGALLVSAGKANGRVVWDSETGMPEGHIR